MVHKRKRLAYTGVVSAIDWDEQNQVSDVALVTDDGCEYFVDPVGYGLSLRDLVNQHLRVIGTVHNDDGCLTISVKRFSRVTEYDHDDG